MADLEIVKKAGGGLSAEELKKKFTLTGADIEHAGAKELVERAKRRIQEGQDFCAQHYQLFHAIDKLVETPFRQASSALVDSLRAKNPTDEAVLKLANDWGLTHLVTDYTDPKTGKPTNKKALNLPVFFQTALPLSFAMARARAGRIALDYLQVPLLKYEPAFSGKKDTRKCELLTSRLEVQGTQFGYRTALRHAIQKAVDYGHQLMFVKEEWYSESSPTGEGKTKVDREGLRFVLPHPSWTYYDQANPISSLNTNSGVDFCGHWSLRKYRDIRLNKALWNNSVVPGIEQNRWDQKRPFFQTVTGGCTMQIPQEMEAFKTMNREANAKWFYNQSFDDAAVFVNEHFELVNPKRDGLGDYDGLVWMRLLMANDQVPLWVAPLGGIPATYWSYNTDDSRMFNVSMVQEAAPWETLITNLLTQHVLTIRQNLANLHFFNTDFVDKEVVDRVRNLGESMYRDLNFAPMSGRFLARGQGSANELFSRVDFAKGDANSIIATINMVLGLMERALGMSAQEVGTYASHEQTREEIQVISQYSDSRKEYAAQGIADAITAWKTQLYDYLMANGSSEIWGMVSAANTSKQELEDLGFTVDEEGGDAFNVKAPKSALAVDYFVSVKEGGNRTNNQAIAAQMFQFLQPFSAKLAQAFPARELAKLLNGALSFFGFPREWKIDEAKIPEEANPDELQQFMAQQIEMLAQKTQQAIAQGDQALMKVIEQQGQQTAQIAEELAGQITKLATENAQTDAAAAQEIDGIKQALTVVTQAVVNQPHPDDNPIPAAPAGGITLDPAIPSASADLGAAGALAPDAGAPGLPGLA